MPIEFVKAVNVEYTSIEVTKLDNLIEQRNALLEALKMVEWIFISDSVGGILIRNCPWCRNGQILGHADNCRRQQAIAKAEGEI